MIKSKKDLKYYLERDRTARNIKEGLFKRLFYPDPTWKFQKRLRRLEYYFNKRKGLFQSLYYYYLEYKYKKLSVKLGFSIPKNAFGPGLAIPHYGLIIVNSNAKIGENCRIHAGVNIGASGGVPIAPLIGNNVYLGPGAKVYGDIKIGNNIAIAANAAVGSSFEEENIVIGGIPAKKISDFDIKRIIKHLNND